MFTRETFRAWVRLFCNDLSRIQTWVTLFLEPFLESVPQMIILTCLAVLSPGIIMMQNWRLFWATYSSSILSSAFGISKFLMAGPTHLLAQEAPLGGFGSIGFLLLIIFLYNLLPCCNFIPCCSSPYCPAP